MKKPRVNHGAFSFLFITVNKVSFFFIKKMYIKFLFWLYSDQNVDIFYVFANSLFPVVLKIKFITAKQFSTLRANRLT